MKKILLLPILILTFFNSHSQEYGGAWFRHYFEGDITGIHFVNDQVGYMSSNISDTAYLDSKAFILKTIDGGNNWEALPSEFRKINNISVIDENTIWLSTDEAGIYKTIDGGSTWQNFNPSEDTNLYLSYNFFDDPYVRFFTANTGYVYYTNNSELLKTTDGGVTWSEVNRYINNLVKGELYIYSDNIIFDYAESFFGDTGLFKSIDSGANWTQLTIPDEINSIDELFRIEFIDEQNGFLVNRLRTYFYQTSDGGVSWVKTLIDFDMHVRSISFMSSSDIYALGIDGLYKLNGTTWDIVSSNILSSTKRLFYTNNKLYITGNKCNLSLYENNNTTQLVGVSSGQSTGSKGANPSLNGDEFKFLFSENFRDDSGDKYFYALTFNNNGKNSTYKKTNIEDSRFSSEKIFGLSNNASNTVEISYPKPNRLLAGQSETEWVKLWDDNNSNTDYTFYKFYYYNETSIIAIFYNKLYRSTDNGDNWNVLHEFTENIPIQDLHVYSENEFVVLDYSNNLLSTTDGGQTWTTNALPFTTDTVGDGNLKNLCVINDDIIWAYGFTNTAIKSTDGGQTWSNIIFNEINNIGNITFLNENEGWVSYSTYVYYTTDGGASWSISEGDWIIDPSPGLSSPSIINSTNGWYRFNGSTHKYLPEVSCPTLGDINTSSTMTDVYDININWSPVANASYYKIQLFFIDPFGDEEVFNIGITSSNSYEFENVEINKIPFLSFENLKARVIACNLQNESLNICDNATDVSSGSLHLTGLDSSLEIMILYPNPSNDFITINRSKQIKEGQIFSINGILIKSFSSNSVDVSNLAVGIYIVRVIDEDNNEQSLKLIKK